MSVASYEGPASRNEIGDQRFRYTLGVRQPVAPAPQETIVAEVAAPVQPEQAQAVGQVTLQHTEVA